MKILILILSVLLGLGALATIIMSGLNLFEWARLNLDPALYENLVGLAIGLILFQMSVHSLTLLNKILERKLP
jgi:hypothetical protein